MDKVKDLIRNVPDFPKPGIMFKDITPLLKNAEGFNRTIELMAAGFNADDVDVICGIESRGFIFASALALKLKKGFVPIRKAGKLPWETTKVKYSLEYGEDVIEVHNDAFSGGARAVLVDDLLATGGTAKAACELIEKTGGKINSVQFVIELSFLNGRDLLKNYKVNSILSY
ncbi:MAG TPA: adenine phosphoribosyltransferase [Candidatus Wallbacteria bacterium]|nr:adenine phosphoribosyltransferase [Candidatus Wallbacteria bacterium]